MISYAYVNGDTTATLIASDPFMLFESFLTNITSEIEESVSVYTEKCDAIAFESELLGEMKNDDSLYIEAEGNNIFEKIGNEVIKIANKIKELIESVIQKIKDIRFKHQSADKKIDELCKKDPSIKQQVVAAYEKGDLKVADMKSLGQMEKEFKELMEAAKKMEIDPKSFRGRVNAFKDKWSDIDKSGLVKIAAAITTVITAAGAGYVFKKHVLDAEKATSEMKKIAKDDYDAYLKTYDGLKQLGKKDGTNYMSDNMTKAQIAQNLYAFQVGKISQLVREEEVTTTKLSDKIMAFVDKVSKGSSADVVKDLEKDNNERKAREKKERKEERRKNKQDAADRSFASSMASSAAKKKWDDSHVDPDAERKEEERAERLAAAQQRGRERVSGDAYNQQKERNRANKEDNKGNGPTKVEVSFAKDKNKTK